VAGKHRRLLAGVLIVGVSTAAAAGFVLLGTGGPGAGNPVGAVVLSIVVGAALLAALLSLVALLIGRSRLVREAVEASRIKPADVAAQLGFDYKGRGPKSLRRRFDSLPELKRGGTIHHALTGRLGDREIVAFQDRFYLQTGQGTIPVEHAIYASEAPAWPSVRIQPWGVADRLMSRFGRAHSVAVESEAFNKAFRVIADDEAFAVTLLSPAMQEMLLEQRRGVRWRIGRGQVCLVRTGKMRGGQITPSIDRLIRFWELVPPELEKWTSENHARSDTSG